ncbi:MAG: glyoxalase [Ilumatobacteraceae bacterium]|nr:glyoxalase [Ilumatobacteraceae bacterium]
MSSPLRSIGAITMFVDDISVSKEWYQRAFELAVLFEDEQSVAFRLDNTIINMLQIDEAPTLIGPAPVAPSGTGSRFQMTIWVDDVDAACAELAERGIELINGPIDRPWGQRTACLADPDGHLWEVAATIG